MMLDVTRLIAAEQDARGAFRSILHWGDRVSDDWNCFATALVLRHLPAAPASAREKALDFLVRCERTDGSFGFWPTDEQPACIRARLSPDSDDSAIAAVELARANRIGRPELRALACRVFVGRRLGTLTYPAPPWLRPGVFLTWLDSRERDTMVDCCANANVVALLAYADLRSAPGYDEACRMIDDGIRWAGDDAVRARSLTPYYSCPRELRYAVQHAVQCGAVELAASLRLLDRLRWAGAPGTALTPICSSSCGSVWWTSPLLHDIRSGSS